VHDGDGKRQIKDRRHPQRTVDTIDNIIGGSDDSHEADP
jgi:hypothetical protein